MTNQWTKVTAGHYRHDETGVEIKRANRFREHGVNVGVRWHLTAPTRDGSTLTIGTTRSLAKAKEWADGENGIVEYRSNEIAIAYAEALAEDVARRDVYPRDAMAYDGNGGVIVPGARSLCLRTTGAHVGHMKAVTAECRVEEGERAIQDAAHLNLINHVDAVTGASVAMYRDVDSAPIEWRRVLAETDRVDITPAGRDYLKAAEVIEGSRDVGGTTGAGKTDAAAMWTAHLNRTPWS